MSSWKGEPTGSDRDAHHVEDNKGRRTDGVRGGRNGPAEWNFRFQEGHRVAG